jgi:thioredoxin reductase (NADPH)
MLPDSSSMLDAIIIGSGAAGLSAALWCDDLKLRHLVLERRADVGGQLHWIHNPVANHLGTIDAANGRAVLDIFAAQLARRDVSIRTNTEVTRIDALKHTVRLAGGEEMAARNIILASGLRRRTLGIPGEAEFRGRGVSASGTRDRNALAGRTVCVIGGGDAAVENALLLAEVCPQVWLVHRGAGLRARPEFVERLADNERITPRLTTRVTRIFGTSSVEGVELQRDDAYDAEPERLPVDAVLVRIGYEPNTELLRAQVDLDDAGYVRVTHEHETSVRGVFAVGDIANPIAPTISGAVGAGATAAKVIEARHRNR